MKVDLETLRRFFASSPFMVSFTEAEVWAETAGQRTLVMKASATMAVTAAAKA